MDLGPPTGKELQQLPHIILTSDTVWDPSTLDGEFSFDEISQDAPFDSTALDLDPRVTASGEYTGNLQDGIDLILADCYQTLPVSHTVTLAQLHFELLRPFFCWMPVDCIEKTIRVPTYCASTTSPISLPTTSTVGMKVLLRKHSSVTLLLMMMASLVMVWPLLWPNSMLARPVSRLSFTPCTLNLTCPRPLKI
jgi:hypothetical protein